MDNKRICVIGAGPSGLSALYNFTRQENFPEIVCYEKQNTWGGLWNLSWRTGLDEYGEPNHGSMYKFMWVNGPKETIEYPDYTYEQHFGKPTPSYPPRAVIRDYIEGRFTRGVDIDLKQFIKFHHVVRYVKYLDDVGKFKVMVADLETGEMMEEYFTHVIVASGIFSTPYIPEIPGADVFEGRILHSHDFRDIREFTDRSVLLIGAAYSGEDLALQCVKFGIKRTILSHRSRPKSATCIMPAGVEEKPLVERLTHDTAYFIDGTSAKVDCVIFCTGYLSYFPFLEKRLRISSKKDFHPEGLYKTSLFLKAGDNRLFYIGGQNQFFTLTYFEVIAAWVARFIMGTLADEPKLPSEMESDSAKWHERANNLKSETDVISFMADTIDHLAELTGYNKDVIKGRELFFDWVRDRKETLGLAGYRNVSVPCCYTGTRAPEQTQFMQNYDDSIEAFLKY